MKFGIVVLSYNHPDITARAVRSALAFSSVNGETLPVWLVHNGSEAKNRERLIRDFPEVRHEILQSNRGYAGGVNAGFQAAIDHGCDWIFLLTNDCEIRALELPRGLAPAMVAPLVHRRKIGRIDSIGGCFIPHRAHLHHLREASEFEALVRAALDSQRTRGVLPGAIAYIPGSAFWIHREVVENTGVLDERLGTYWDDVDYCARILARGYPLLFQPSSEAVHQVGKTNHKHALYTTYFFQRNRRVISRRYVGRSLARRAALWWTLQSSAATLAARLLLARDFSRLRLLSQALRDADRL